MKFVVKYCECGCGLETPKSPYTRRSEGRVRGEPIRFLHGHSGLRRTSAPLADGWIVEDGPLLSPCWIWQRSVTRDGYAHARVDGKIRRVHRVMWERTNGAVPSGLELDHLCRVRACVNPDHLEPVSHAENVRRGLRARGWTPSVS